ELIILHSRRESIRDRITGRDAQMAPEDALAEQLAPWRLDYPMVPIELRVVHGAAAEELLRAASTARLVVVGTHGHSAPARTILGSTSRTLVRHSACPIIVVHRDIVGDEFMPARAATSSPAVLPRHGE